MTLGCNPPLGRVPRLPTAEGLGCFRAVFRVLRGSARSRWPRCLVGDETWRVVSRAGNVPPVRVRPGLRRDQGKSASVCGAASSCATCIDTEGLEPMCLAGTGRRLTRRALSSAVRRVALDGAVLGARRGSRVIGSLRASPRPDPETLHARRRGRRRKRRGARQPLCRRRNRARGDGAGPRWPLEP